MKASISELSTMIFGLALSIGALTLINTVETNSQLVVSSILTFAYSFLIIIFVWLRYTRILEIIKVETSLELNLNILLLFLVAIEPYLFNLLHSGTANLLNFNSAVFGLDLGLMLTVMGILYSIAIITHKEMEKDTRSGYRYGGNGLFISGIIILISAFPPFWSITVHGINLRFILWGVALLVGTLFRRFKRSKKLAKANR